MKWTNKQKLGVGCIGLFISFLLVGNSNNIPENFAARLFPSVKLSQHSMLHYSAFIILILLYLSLKYLNEGHEFKLIKTGFRRFIIMIILLNMFTSMWGGVVKTYKSFATDLNAVYLNRDTTKVNFLESNGRVMLDGRITLENCSSEYLQFRLKLKVPSMVKYDFPLDYYIVDQVMTLNPKTEHTIRLDEFLTLDNNELFSSYTASSFEYVLFNENSEVVFKGTESDYWFDELDWLD